ncbi:MAG TPA: hypothetical protein VMH20_14805 [Verrucomicrobiae bacterium]|nr:hypothetical protein [Verrucomicrobiae bacterium]
MKIQNILRHATAAAFGLALLWASTVPVQAQEISNSEFPDGPYVSSFDQTIANLPASAPATPTATPADNALTTAAVPTPTVAEQAVVSVGNYIRDTLIASSLFGLSLFALYAIAEIRRSALPNRNRFTRGAALS